MGAPRKPSFTVTIDEDVIQAITALTEALKANTAAHTGGTPTEVTEAPPQAQEAPQEVLPPANYVVPALQVPQQMPTMPVPQAQEAPITTPVGYQMPVTQIPVQQLPVQQMPVQQAPVQQMPVQQPLPTTVPTYSIEQIMQGFARAMDAGQPALALLQKYGANMVNEINPANYGLVATDLRAMGVQI